MSRIDDHDTAAEEGGFQVALEASVMKIGADETDPAAYLAWARRSLPVLMNELAGYETAEASRLAFWIARAIWSATPLESNRYRPRPLAPPERNAPCPCGTGRKYKHCCRNLPSYPEIPTEAIWPALVACRPDKHWLDAAKAHRLPTTALLAAAASFVERSRWRSLKDLAETAIGEGVVINDPQLSLLVHPLCDAYDALYRTDRKKRALLERLAGHPLEAIRSEACQRLASWLHDRGERDAAWAALIRALRATPDDPGIAALEISLLVSEQAYDQASERAGYWLRRFERQRAVPEELLDFLSQVRADPQRALADVSRGAAPSAVSDLLEWIDQQAERPLPDLAWSRVPGEPGDAMLQDAYEPLSGDGELALVDGWHARTGIGKPFSVQWISGDEAEAWLRSDEWLPWLESHPQALDSFAILDDLIRLLLAAEELVELIDNPWAEALVERGVRMLLGHWPDDRVGRLPWIIMENRPALRILSHAILRDADGRSNVALLRAYLRLNPSDNHGFRGMLINTLLQAGDDTAALRLAGDYQDDGMAEILYGCVLALYRTGRRGEAVNALVTAAEHLPLVLDFLVRERVATPRLHPGAVTMGGKDEAWLYRESMRDTWLATEGMLDWLKPLARRLKAKSRSGRERRRT